MCSEDERIQDIKDERTVCPHSSDGKHSWIVYGGGYTTYLDEDVEKVDRVYGSSRLCHDCDYIEEHVRSS